MKLVKWKFNSLEVPMIEIEKELYCTSKAICGALNVNLTALTMCYQRNLLEFGSPLDSQNVSLREFLKEHKEYLGIKRVKADLNLWSEQQMFLFAVHISSPSSIQFREELWSFIKQHVQVSTVTLDMYRELESRNESLEARLAMQEHMLLEMDARITAIQTPMDQIATHAGKMLCLQKGTKPFRTSKEIKTN